MVLSVNMSVVIICQHTVFIYDSSLLSKLLFFFFLQTDCAVELKQTEAGNDHHTVDPDTRASGEQLE